MTHYQVLGVDENATADEIKQAYRKLAMQHHPDRGGDAEQFQKIQQAYSVLSDDNGRQQYDHERQFGNGGFRFTFNGQPFGDMPPDMADLFGQFGFSGGPFGNFRARPRNRDLRVEVAVDLESTLEQQTKILSIQTTTGERFNVEVTIPRGITTGSQIKYSGMGDNQFNNIPRGDLYVVVVVRPHHIFNQHGLDLILTKTIDCFDAVLGCEIEVETLEKKKILVTIPPGTQFGTRLKVAGQGLWHMQAHTRGNLIVEIAVSVPKNLTSEQLNMLKNIKNGL